MKEYNVLTQQLLAAGYTIENYPDYVRIGNGMLSGDDPLNNLYGGFEYKRKYLDEFVYKTGCGKYVMGSKVIDNMSYMGIYWSHENDCPVIRCPYDKPDCDLNDERLHGTFSSGLSIQCWCVCHRTEEPFDYESSIEKANKERSDERERKYEEFSIAHNGRVCRNHMVYNEQTREWHMAYKPERCAHVCYSKEFCPIFGRQLSKKRGNVYYDLKKSGIRHDGTLWDGEPWTHITKGIRYFKSPCSIDICEAFVKVSSDEILKNYQMNNSWETFHDPSIKVEVLNIRAESKPSRDLMQDLEDIKAGVEITHDSDNIKREKEYKHAKRQQAYEKRIQKLEKKILEVGYENLKDSSLDKIHADKWLTNERIRELEEVRQQKIREEREKPVQMSLFDYF